MHAAWLRQTQWQSRIAQAMGLSGYGLIDLRCK
jgi:hypothetical protein